MGAGLCGVAAAGPVGADDAVGFQIGHSHAGSQPSDTLVPPLRQAWAVDLPAAQTNPQFSYPLIVAGHVFVTGWRYGQPGSLTALALASGSVVWGPIDIGGDGHWSALTYDNGAVYTVVGDGTVNAVDAATGAVLWTRALAAGVHAEPAAGSGAVYVATSSSLVALRESDGAPLWSRAIATSSSNTPAVVGGQVFVSDGPGAALAFDASGTQLWRHVGGTGDARAVAVYQGRVFVRDSSDWSKSLILDAASGAAVGTFRSQSIPAFSGNLAIELNNGVLSAQDLTSGNTVWTFTGDVGLTVTPIVVNGYVYTGSWDGELYALNAATGAVVWMAGTANLPAGSETGASAPLLGLAAGQGYLVVPVFCQRCKNSDGGPYELVAYTTGSGVQSAAAPNDPFSASVPLAANPGSFGGSNVGATRETGEPDHAGAAVGHSVWYSFTASRDGFVDLTVRSETLPILVAAYRGGGLQSLITEAADAGLTAGSPHTSRIQLPVNAATTYRFAIDTTRAVTGSPATGSFTLDPIFQPADPVLSWTAANDYFARALLIPNGVTAADFYTLHASKEFGEPNHAGNPGGNSVWFEWTAPANGTFTFASHAASFDVLLGIYTGSSVSTLTTVAGAAAPVGAHDAAVSFSAKAGHTYMFAVDGRDGASGTGELTITAGSSPPASATPPETTITAAPPATTSSSGASFSFVSSASESTFACSLDAGPFTLCSSPAAYSGLAVGVHSFQVKAVDPAGTSDPTPASYNWTIEPPPPPPDTTITSAPPATTTATDASFSFVSSQQDSSFLCSLDDVPFTLCASPVSYSGLAVGTHSFQVKAVGPAGNADPTPASYTWTIEAPPETTITAAPPTTTTASDASFAFVSSAPNPSFKCSLDEAAFTPCNSPVGYSGLAVGAHTFRVQAIDAHGNVDPTPASYGWTIEAPVLLPPETTITSGPPSATTASEASFTFVSSAPFSTFTCSLDGSAFTACTSPANYSGLTVGTHSFRVEAIDAVGTPDPTPASYSWTIAAPPSTPPPETTITSAPPAMTSATDAAFSFTSSAPNATFECSLDGAAFTPCGSPAGYTQLAVGSHSFRVEAIDPTGNADPTPASYTWTITASVSGVHGATTTLRVRILGQPIVGHRLHTLARPRSNHLSYRWKLCTGSRCSSIHDATRPSLRVRRAWLGARLRVTVTALVSGGRASAVTGRVRTAP